MSGEDYTKRTDKVRKELNTLRKDINYRDEQDKRGEATYTLDAEINGQFTQIVRHPPPRTRSWKSSRAWPTISRTASRTTASPTPKPPSDTRSIKHSSMTRIPSSAPTIRSSRRSQSRGTCSAAPAKIPQ
jgi:hypothetical protein